VERLQRRNPTLANTKLITNSEMSALPLTKTRFQIGMECPTKLYYHLNSDKYPNQKLDDPFLEALAKGGFQVGALARAYFPGGVLVTEESNKAAVEKTKELLKQENCSVRSSHRDGLVPDTGGYTGKKGELF